MSISSYKKFAVFTLVIACVNGATTVSCERWTADSSQDISPAYTLCMNDFLLHHVEKKNSIKNAPQYYHLPIIRPLPAQRSLA